MSRAIAEPLRVPSQRGLSSVRLQAVRQQLARPNLQGRPVQLIGGRHWKGVNEEHAAWVRVSGSVLEGVPLDLVLGRIRSYLKNHECDGGLALHRVERRNNR